jgi:phosphate-selective porin
MFKSTVSLALCAPVVVSFAAAPAWSQAEPQEADSGLEVAYGEGLTVSWPGGELGLEGLLEVGVRAYAAEGARDPESEFYLKRFRPELFGHFDGGWRFRFEPNFHADEVELEEAWVGRDLLGGTLRLGRMKAPFGLEEVRSRRNVHFPRFSVLNQFSPAEEHGVFFHGQEGAFEYGVAVVNGTSGAEEDAGKDVVARGMWHFGEADGARFHIGLAGTVGDEGFGIGGDVVKNAGGAPALEFAPGAELDGRRTRLGLELTWFDGPWMVQSELVSVSEELRAGAATGTATYEGVYIDVARALTGEALDFGGVAEPNDSWVAALRVSSLDLSDELANPAFVLPGMAPGRIDSVSLGLSYIPGAHTIWRAAWAHSFYADPITVGGKSLDDEGVLTVELQLHF